MKTGKAVIFTGGLGPEPLKIRKIVEDAELIIAADSGWDLACSAGIVPGYYIGDMDSVDDHKGVNELPESNLLKFPVDKDYTDTELALKFVDDADYRDIVLIGGGGGRIDHLLAITSLFEKDPRPSEWFTAEEQVVFIERDCDLVCRIGQTISVFPCPGSSAVVSTEGLKWELENFKLTTGNYSLSNTALNESINIHVHTGAVLLIMNY